MIPGNIKSKMNESPTKTSQKNKISQNVQNKKTSEKNGLTPRSNTDTVKSSKTGDQRPFVSVPRKELQSHTQAEQHNSTSGKRNNPKTVGSSPAPLRALSDARRKINPGTSSIPLIKRATTTTTRLSSVTQSKLPFSKRTITAKNASFKKSSNYTNPAQLSSKSECSPSENSTKLPFNVKNVNGLKKSTTCPPCMKLEHDVNSTLESSTSYCNLPESCQQNVAGPGQETRILSPEKAERITVNITSMEQPKQRPTQTQVKRMRSQGDSILSGSACIVARKAPLLPRRAASEIKDLRRSMCCKGGADKKTSINLPTEKKPSKLVNSGLNDQVLHVHTIDVTTAQEIEDLEKKHVPDIKELPRGDSSDRNLNLPDHLPLRPIEFYESSDSVDTKIHQDEFSAPYKNKSRDFLVGTDDDGDTFSDIAHPFNILPDEKDPDRPTPRERTTDFSNVESLEKKGPDKVKEEVGPKKNIHPPSKESPGNKDNVAKLEEVIRLKQTKGRFSVREEPSIPSEFFQTHKNLGFIGREEDEERVSFDPALVTLYQPREKEMLFYDLANCIATQAYLKMCGIEYVLAERKNAENMSPSGKVPFLSSCLCIIPEFEGIVSFMQYKKYSCVRIEECDKPAFRATISLIVDTLEAAERYMCWYDEEIMTTYTKPKVEGLFPFPLNHIIYWKKKYAERKRLALEEIKEKPFPEILSSISQCFNALSQLLGENNFFFGDGCTEIDALVYGHIYAAFTTRQQGLFRDLQFIIKRFPNLIIFATNFDKRFLLNKFSSLNLPLLG